MSEIARPLAAGLIAALWLLQEVHIAGVASGLIALLTLTLLAVYACAGFLVSRTVLRVVAGFALVTAFVLSMHYDMPASLLAGARSAVLFIAFLASMQMLKVAIELGPGLDRIRRDHEALQPREQHDAMMLRSWLVASIFAAGTLSIVAPLVSAERPDEERNRLAQSALQGVGLALLWSPFFVAMAVCTRLTTGLTLGAALANGVAMALLGVAVSHFAFGGRLRAGWMKPLVRVAAGTVVMALAILLIHHFWGLSNSEAIVVLVPLVALLLARDAVAASPRNFARRWLTSLEAIAGEALLVSASLVLGEIMKDLIAQGVLRVPAGLASWPVPLLILWPMVAMAALAAAGFHPIIGATLFFPLQSSLPALHPVVAGGSVLTGWMFSVLVSRFAVPVMFAATMFRVGARDLVRGNGLRFCVLFGPVAWGWLWGLNQALLGGR